MMQSVVFPCRLPTVLAAVAMAAVLANQTLHAQCGPEDAFVEDMVAIPDLGTGLYQGFEGGLYPDGQNDIPPEHYLVGQERNRFQIVPRDANGDVDVINGKIGLISMGMSNPSTEFHFLQQTAANDPELNPHLVLINGAQGGKTANEWADPNDECWNVFETRIQNAGLTPEQVQVVWLKVVARTFELQAGFPDGPLRTMMLLRESVRNLKDKYPHIRVLYLSCRTYGGWAVTGLNPEPFAYEHGFSVKWLLEDQLLFQDPELSFDEPNAEAPWMAWGPYLWANGLGEDLQLGGVPGRSDGLEYECDDFRDDDRTHPSEPQGAQKIGELILDWFKTSDLTAPWFRAASTYVEPSTALDDLTVEPGADSVPMVQFQLTPHLASDNVEFVAVEVKARGDGKDSDDIERVQLIWDADQDGLVTLADTALAEGTFADNNGVLTLTLTAPFALTRGTPQQFLVAYDMAESLAAATQAWIPVLLVVPLLFLRKRRWFGASLVVCITLSGRALFV